MEGFYYLAVWNKVFISFYDSPTNLDIKSADETLKNVPPSIAVAHALAK